MIELKKGDVFTARFNRYPKNTYLFHGEDKNEPYPNIKIINLETGRASYVEQKWFEVRKITILPKEKAEKIIATYIKNEEAEIKEDKVSNESIDWLTDRLKDARWEAVGKISGGLVRKIENQGFIVMRGSDLAEIMRRLGTVRAEKAPRARVADFVRRFVERLSPNERTHVTRVYLEFKGVPPRAFEIED